MSNEKISLTSLLKKQETERQELAAGAYEAWLPVKENETRLLASFDGNYEKADPEVQAQINKGREEYFGEYGADGKLAALMHERQIKERETLARKQLTLDHIRQSQQPNKNHDRER